jgi:sugar O-acyltransferase (sialic acid O-acetyltransferase NeuD family)
VRLIAILGGHSSGLIVADTVAAMAAAGEPIAVLGFLNDEIAVGERIGGFPVVGRFEDWRRVVAGVRFVAAFPFPGAARARHARLRSLGIPDERWETIRHPSAQIAPSAALGRGCYVAANVVVEHGAVVGAHAILRAGAYVSHDVRIGEFAFVGPSATLLGRSVLGEGAHVGANAVCREKTNVGAYALIGIGAVVVGDVAAAAVVAGNPARPLS